MSRARRAGPVALPIALVLALATASLVAAARRPDGTVAGATTVGVAAVSWPTSTLLISEVETGGASASDELVELTNAGAEPGRPDGPRGRLRDVDGLDRHAEGDVGGVDHPRSRPPPADRERGRDPRVDRGRDVCVGVRGDGRGGGAPAVGGNPIDAVAWGDATNAFVEGTAAPAPPAGSSLERLPGGSAGNGTDTNVNAADFVVGPPTPQNLAAAATPPAAARARRPRRHRVPTAVRRRCPRRSRRPCRPRPDPPADPAPRRSRHQFPRRRPRPSRRRCPRPSRRRRR